jgi:low affinity Fe/Cu permease
MYQHIDENYLHYTQTGRRGSRTDVSFCIMTKLNEIVFAMRRAKNDLIHAEKMSDEELEELEAKYARIREICEMRLEKRKTIPSETAA